MWSGPDERNLAKLRVTNIIIPMFNLSNSEMTSFGKCIVCLVLGLTTYFYCGGEYYNTNTVSRRFYIFTNDWRLQTSTIFTKKHGTVLSNNGHIILFKAVNKYGTRLRQQLIDEVTMSLFLINFRLEANDICQKFLDLYFPRNGCL